MFLEYWIVLDSKAADQDTDLDFVCFIIINYLVLDCVLQIKGNSECLRWWWWAVGLKINVGYDYGSYRTRPNN